MDGSEKKRVSKWDLQETQFPLENAQDNVFPDNLTAVKYSRHSPEVAGDNGSKWSSMETDDMQKAKHDYARPVRERLSGSRGSQKNDNINKDSSEYSEATMEWERDGSYNMRTSPGFDRRRHQNHSRSPKSSWSRSIRSRSRSRSRSRTKSRSRSRSRSRSSRSRSRTPPYGFKREPFVNNRSRSRSRVPTQPCKDFAAGRCRRGSHCPFLHEANQRYEDRRYPEGGLADNWESRHRKSGAARYPDPYDTRERERSIRGGRDTQCCNDFLKGKCQRGSSCRYSHDDGLVNEAIHDRENDQRNRGASFAHDDASDGYGKGSANEVIRNRENDRRNRGASFARDGASDGHGKSSANEVIRDRENDRRNQGASFAHDGASDGYGRSFSNEVMRDRESDRRNRGASFDRGFEREPRRNGTIPCKFFAAGNCRNGNHCRFYHDVHASVSPGKRSRDDRWGMDRRADNADPWMEAPKWNDRTSLSDGLNLHEEKIDVINPEARINTWDMDGRWEHNLDNRTQCGLTSTDKSDGKEILQWKAEDSGASLGVSESRGNESGANDKWLGDMSPEWNYQVQSSDLVKEDQTGHIAQSSHPPSLNKSSLPTPEWEYGMPSSGHIIKEEPSQINHTSQSLDLGNTSEWDYGVRASDRIIKGEPGQIKPSSLNHNNASEWDYGVQASDQIIKEEPGQINQNSLNHSNTSLPTSEWDYGVCASDHIIKEKPGQINQSSKKHSKTSSQTQSSDVTDEESVHMNRSSQPVNNTSLPTPEQDITREASGQILMQHSAPPKQPIIYQQPRFQQTSISMGNSAVAIGSPHNNNTVTISQDHQNFPANNFPGQSFDQNNQSGQPLSSLNGVGQGQSQLQPPANLSTSGQPLSNFNGVGQGQGKNQPLSNFNGVGQGQGKNQSQLPYPSNPNLQIQPSFQDMKSSNNADTSGILRPTQNMVSSEQLAQIAQFLPQIYGSVNPPKSMEIVAPVSSASIQPNLAVGSQNQYDPLRDSNDQIKSDLSNHPPGFSSNPIGQETIMGRKSDLTAKSEVAQENKGTVVAEEKKKTHEETKKVRESSPEGDGDGKKCKDVKGIRAFKFALVEFVKELLKPAWKEGQIGKEAYKTIAKKVVDKVTGTIQGAHIPQTQEKIDQYLSFSKPKLTKLVHAYVEKHQKG